MGKSSISPKLLLLLVPLLLLAPPVLIQARELGARRGGGGGSSREHHVVAGLPLRMLPAEPSEDDGGGGIPPKLVRGALMPGVSRPGGLAPPAPKPSYGPHPLHEHEAPSSHGDGLASSFPGVSGRQEQAPPAPQGNTPPQNSRPGPAADVARVFRDALARFLDWIAA
ncbi:hypothetical protein BS78_09G221700 [Paspalum vaginatum]|nr:hypothetical protein BS78_09G221700 [Paspalum vaginatum]